MWLLLIIFIGPEILNVQELDHYATWKECQTERNRIGFEMAEAYPWDRDFVIACQFRQRIFGNKYSLGTIPSAETRAKLSVAAYKRYANKLVV